MKKTGDEISQQMKEKVNEPVRNYFLLQKEKINLWIRIRVEKMLLKLLISGKKQVSESLKEDDMPKCIQSVIDDAVEEIWPDIEEEILYRTR